VATGEKESQFMVSGKRSFISMPRLIAGILCFLILFPLSLKAEEDVGKQIWLDVNPRWYNTSHLKITGEFGIRRELTQKKWTRYGIKPSVAYSVLDGLDIGAGVGVNYTDNIDKNTVEIDNYLAIIPFQGLNYIHPLSEKWKMNYYLRIEEKFDYNTQTWESLNSLRVRFRIRTLYEFDAYQTGRYYRATLSWEGFNTVNGDDGLLTEKARVSVGIERNFSYRQKVRLELTWQNQSLAFYRENQTNNYNEIYLRLRYFPSWGTVIRNKFRDSD